MDRLFFKTILTTLFIFVIEIFLSGYAMLYLSIEQFEKLQEHFAFSYERFIEIAWFHLLPMSVVLFIVLHLLPIIRIKKSITKESIIAYVLLFVSHILWFVLQLPLLKLLGSVSLFIFICYLSLSILQRVYGESHFV